MVFFLKFLKHYPFRSENAGTRLCFLSFFIFLFTALSCCASIPHNKSNILAMVNGEPITIRDFQYALEIEHRRDSLSPSTARTFDISFYIQKMIDDKLIAQEAYRMGLDQDPLIQKTVDDFVLRESVVLLRNEEILQKISITEEEMKDYYEHNYEKFFLDAIELPSREKAIEILDQLKKEDSFTDLAAEHPAGLPKNENGEIVATRRSMGETAGRAVSGLGPGEFSDIIETHGKFFIVKLLRREKATDEEFEGVRESIKQSLRKEKERQISSDYLQSLRQKSSIKIDRDMLSSLDLPEGKETDDRISEDMRPLTTVDGSVLTVGEFLAMVPPGGAGHYERFLDMWIDRKVVDHEALSRHYEERPELMAAVNRYRNALLMNKFTAKIIVPLIEVPDGALEAYYEENRNDFLKPSKYRIQQITAGSREEASEILNSLKNGASFSWLARERSIDQFAQKGGNIGWMSKDQLSVPAQEALALMETGDISPVFEVDGLFRILRLQDRSTNEIAEFEMVKDAVFKAYTSRQYNDILKKYVETLKEDAQILVNEDIVHDLESRF